MSTGGAAGIDAARRRVGATLDRTQRVEVDRVVVATAGPAVIEARRRALDAATEAGRSGLVEEARRAAAAFVRRAFARQGFSGTWALTEMAVSVARPEDRAAVAEALADAVTADVVEDLVDDETLDALRAGITTIEASSAIPDTSSISNLTASFVEIPTRRGGWVAVLGGLLLLVLGVTLLLASQVLGIALIAAAAAIAWNILRR
jgi:hypothetical protein